MRKKILIIDDDKDVCQVLAKNLNEEGYDTSYELRGEGGVARVRRFQFDAVILDLKLPDMYGTDVMKKIRRFNQDIPIIILTGYPSLDSAVETIRQRGVDYLRKPFNVSDLRAVVQRAIDYKDYIPDTKLTKLRSIGRKIKEIRKSKKWSLDVLAEKTGLSKSFLSEMERAKRFPRLSTLQKIARVLEVNLQFFMK